MNFADDNHAYVSGMVNAALRFAAAGGVPWRVMGHADQDGNWEPSLTLMVDEHHYTVTIKAEES